MRINIHSPDYQTSSAGIRSLHYLGYLAHQLGHRVMMCTGLLNAEWGQYSQINDEADLTIVPEVHGLTTPHDGNVVRWVLYYPGRLGGPSFYRGHEQVWIYNDDYRQAAEIAAPGRKVRNFWLPNASLPGFNKSRTKDFKIVFFQGKGAANIPKPDNVEVEITRNFPATRHGLVELLQRTEKIYLADRYTVLREEATLCGCEVYHWADDHWFKAEIPEPGSILMDEPRDLERVRCFLQVCARDFSLGAT